MIKVENLKWTPKKGVMSERVVSEEELCLLGGGEVAYIKCIMSDDAQKAYPCVGDLPENMLLFALHHADGTPIALTDSFAAAIGHAKEDELDVHSVH